MQTWLHKSPLMYFINICSSPPHLSWSSKPIPSGSHWNRQHHIWQLLFLYCILNRECSLYCVLLHNTLICVCAHTVILARQSNHFTLAHPGPIVPLWLMLISTRLGGAGSWWWKWRWERMLVCTAWDHFQVYFAVDYSSVRWHWHLDSAALTEHIHLKAQMSTKATE